MFDLFYYLLRSAFRLKKRDSSQTMLYLQYPIKRIELNITLPAVGHHFVSPSYDNIWLIIKIKCTHNKNHIRRLSFILLLLEMECSLPSFLGNLFYFLSQVKAFPLLSQFSTLKAREVLPANQRHVTYRIDDFVTLHIRTIIIKSFHLCVNT